MKLLAPLCFISWMGGSLASGAVLSQWTFNSVTVSASSVAAGLTASDFTPGGTFPGTVGANSTVSGVGGTATFVFGASGIATTESGAVAGSDILTFTVTPTAGNAVSYSQLSFYGWANAGFTNNSLGYHFFIRSDVTGVVTLGTFDGATHLANTTQPGASDQFTLSLASVSALQNVTTATQFTIGVYFDASTSNGNLRIDSVDLQGTVAAVPEISAPLCATAGIGLLLARRRRL